MPSPAAPPFDFAGRAGDFERHHLAPFRQRRMAELSALCRVVTLECPALAAESGLAEACRRLRAAGAGAAPVLRSPGLLLWINVARHLVLRDTHRALPLGHVRDHFLDLQRFAFAAACAEGEAAEARAGAALDGRVTLPGLGLALALDRREAGRVLHLATDGKTVTARMGKRAIARAALAPDAAAEGGWRVLPRLMRGIVLDDSVEMWRPHSANNPAWRIEHPDDEAAGLWVATAGRAGALLSAAAADLWVPVEAVLAAVVPLQSTPQVNLSGTCADVLGCICSSLPANAALLAETLAHEAAHTTLHVLTDALAYWQPDEKARLYRSPWRKDLRPISGMVHGVFAFLAVAELWAALMESAAAPEFDALGRLRLRTVTRQLRLAIDEIGETGELTAAGTALVAAAERRLRGLAERSRDAAPGAAEAAAIEERLGEHALRLGTPPPADDAPRVARPDAAWSRQLEAEMPPPVNAPALRLARREAISDRIHCAAMTGEAVVAEWEALLRQTAAAEPQSAALVRGSIAYGRGDFAAATAAYAAYVEERWADLDAWRLLGAALRRAGRPEDALAIAFGLDALQRQSAGEVRAKLGRDWPFHLHRIAADGG